MRQRTSIKVITALITMLCIGGFARVATTAILFTHTQVYQPTSFDFAMHRFQCIPEGGPYDLEAVHMADATHGWAVGKNGVILKTGDGGQTWSYQCSGTTENLWGVDALDRYVAYAVGEGYTILRTDDGGQTWEDPRQTPLSSWNVRLNDVYLLNEDTVVIVGGTSTSSEWWSGERATFLRTTNGGWTWESYPLSFEICHPYDERSCPEMINAVDFVDDNVGIAVGGSTGYSFITRNQMASSIIAKTEDGGVTWVKEESPFDQSRYWYVPDGRPALDVDFYDQTHTAVVAQWGVDIAFSADGGESWIKDGLCGMEENAIVYLDADTLIVVGWGNSAYDGGPGSAVIRSTDGGAYWDFVYSRGETRDFAIAALRSVSSSETTVVAVGHESNIIWSDDAGVTWEEVLW